MNKGCIFTVLKKKQERMLNAWELSRALHGTGHFSSEESYTAVKLNTKQ